MTFSTRQIMLIVAGSTLPAIGALTWLYGWGVLWNFVWLIAACYATEWVCLSAKAETDATDAEHSINDPLTDGSCLVTAILMGICLPPFTDWWLLVLASVSAIGLAKHAYGGVGRNLFNPAMVGYAVVIVSYPEALRHWPEWAGSDVDALSGATLLTEFRYRDGLTVAEFELLHDNTMDRYTLPAWLFLGGGAVLTVLRLIAWRILAGCFAGLALAALFGFDQGSSLSHGSFSFHLLSGGFAAAACYVATDPVTHPAARLHQWLFGVVVGLLTYLIRAFGVFPDGIAFAVLLANCLTPFLNRLHRMRLTTLKANV